MEYEEFEVDEVKPEHIGLEYDMGDYGERWQRIVDVGLSYFLVEVGIAVSQFYRHRGGRLRRPIQKPKMKRVALGLFQSASGAWWPGCAAETEDDFRKTMSTRADAAVRWPHGEFFEVPE